MKKILSEQPLVHPTAEVHDCTLGRYTDIGARTTLLETEVGDYSYIVKIGRASCRERVFLSV